MERRAAVFEENYTAYLERIGRLDLAARAEILGLALEPESVAVSWFGEILRVSDRGIADISGRRPDYATCVVICNYLLRCPRAVVPATGWAHYRDFKDSGPLTVYFSQDVERALVDRFSGRLEALRRAGQDLRGRPPDMEVNCDGVFVFEALPRVSLMLMFNDADEEFPADCSLLFDNAADKYLDAESLAIVGRCLVERLQQRS
ncbi:MAG: DUF3786 domain-containing protein [Desulfosudaceae bacterium]